MSHSASATPALLRMSRTRLRRTAMPGLLEGEGQRREAPAIGDDLPIER
jgi:hypothetical protein